MYQQNPILKINLVVLSNLENICLRNNLLQIKFSLSSCFKIDDFCLDGFL